MALARAAVAALVAALCVLGAEAQTGRKVLAVTGERVSSRGDASSARSSATGMASGGLSIAGASSRGSGLSTGGLTTGDETTGARTSQPISTGGVLGLATASEKPRTGLITGTAGGMSKFGALTSPMDAGTASESRSSTRSGATAATAGDTGASSGDTGAAKGASSLSTTSSRLIGDPSSAKTALESSILAAVKDAGKLQTEAQKLEAKLKKKADAVQDPILTGFDQVQFMFFGQPKSIYSLLSQQSHQASMRLKEAPKEISDFHGHGKRIGTYMDAIAVRFKSHDVLVELNDAASSLTVVVNGNVLRMGHGEVAQTHLLQDNTAEDPESGASLLVLWDTARQDMYQNASNLPRYHSADGTETLVTEVQAVELQTDLLHVTVWRVPYGTWHNDVGMAQPSYLNIRLTMLKGPAGPVEGVIGETYERAVAMGVPADTAEGGDLSHTKDWEWFGKGQEVDYEQSSFVDVSHKFNAFASTGAVMSGATSRRLQTEGLVTFPLSAEVAGPL